MLNEFLENTLLRKSSKKNIVRSIAIDIAAIMMWRGIWGLLDLYAFPSHPEFSLITSALLGLGIILYLKYTSK